MALRRDIALYLSDDELITLRVGNPRAAAERLMTWIAHCVSETNALTGVTEPREH